MGLPSVQELFRGATPEDILLWRRPQATGLIVGVVALVLFLFGWLQYTWLTFACRALQVLLALFGLLTKLSSSPPTPDDIAAQAGKLVGALHPYFVAGAKFIAKILLWEDTKMSSEALFASLILAFLGNLFSDLTVVFLLAVLLFAGPKVYEQNKEAIDEQLAKLKSHADDVASGLPSSGALKKTE